MIVKYKVLFVCMGNICRSPTAEGVFRRKVSAAGWSDRVHIDSAGTHDYHVGAMPDRRARQAALQRGYDLDALRGRQVTQQDFHEFDYILAMDNENLANLKHICPPQHLHKLSLFMAFSRRFNQQEVPDPYYGGGQGFEMVLDMAEDASAGLLETLRALRIEAGQNA